MIKNILFVSLLALFMAACATNSQQGGGSETSSQQSTAVEPASSTAAEGSDEDNETLASTGETFLIPSVVPYSSQATIAENILQSCTELGRQFSDSVMRYSPKFGVNVAQVTDPLPIEGRVVDLTIEQAYSGGNAFIGHRKSVTVAAKLMVDGKMISSTRKMRNSGGGFFGGFSGSCDVLERTVNTLGSDISRWLSEQ